MSKYYIALLLIAGVVLCYVFLQDPCNQLIKTDFSGKYPDYKIMFTGATDGSPESVQCHITYQKPDSEHVYEDVWLYQNPGSGWTFSRVLKTVEKEG
jgi:hypothetical protein